MKYWICDADAREHMKVVEGATPADALTAALLDLHYAQYVEIDDEDDVEDEDSSPVRVTLEVYATSTAGDGPLATGDRVLNPPEPPCATPEDSHVWDSRIVLKHDDGDREPAADDESARCRICGCHREVSEGAIYYTRAEHPTEADRIAKMDPGEAWESYVGNQPVHEFVDAGNAAPADVQDGYENATATEQYAAYVFREGGDWAFPCSETTRRELVAALSSKLDEEIESVLGVAS